MANRSVLVRLIVNPKGAVEGFQKAGLAAKDFNAELAKSEKKRRALADIGNAAGAMGVGFGAAVTTSVVAAAKFDKAMSSVDAATHESARNMELLRKAAIKAGADTSFSATEAAAGIEELAKAGVSTRDILAGGLTGALDLAAAGSIGVAEAAEITASTMNQFNLSGADTVHIADLLAATAGKAQGGVTDMGNAFKYVGPVAAQMGVSIEETAGAVGLLASNGILGDQAGTSLRGMLSSLTSPSQVASDTMKSLGINVYDATGQFVGFEGVAGQLKSQMGDLTNAERDQALGRLFGNEQITAARILYDGGAQAVAKWTKNVDDQGYAADTAARKMDNLSGDLERLKGSLETAFIKTGDGADGPLRKLTQGADGLVHAYGKAPAPIQNTALAIGALGATVGGTVFVATRAVNAYHSMNDTLETLGMRSKRTGDDVGGFNKKAFAIRAGAGAASVGLLAMADSAGQVNKGLGNLTTIAGSAAGGFAVGGPWGAAIGAGAGALSIFASESAKTAERVDRLTASLDAQTGAVTASTGKMLADALQKSGAITAADNMGISLEVLTKAAIGQADALAYVNAQLDKYADKGTRGLGTRAGAGAASAQQRDVVKVSGALKEQSGALAESRQNWKIQQTAADAATGPQKTVKGAVDGTTSAVDTQTAALADLKKAQDDLKSGNLSTYESQTRLKQAYRDAAAAAKDNRNGIKNGGEAAIKARESISSLASAWNDASDEAQDKPGAYKKARRQFIDLAEGMGYSSEQARRLAKRLLEVPKKNIAKVKTQGIPQAQREVEDFKGNVRRNLNDIGPFEVDIVLSAQAKATMKAGNFGKGGTGNAGVFGAKGMATGGEVPLWMGEAGKDSVPIMGMPGEHMFTVSDVKKLGGQAAAYRLRQQIQAGKFTMKDGFPFETPHYATGGAILSPNMSVNQPAVNRAVGSVESDFAALAKRIEASLSKSVSKAAEAAATSAGTIDLSGLSGSPSGRTTLDGEPLTRITKAQILLARQLSNLSFRVMQGSFQPATSYSGTSHTGPGVADIAPSGAFAGQGWLRRVGFASWARNIPGAHSAGSGAHTHNVSLLDPGSRNNGQARAYKSGGDGLGGRDYGPNPPVLSDLVARIKAMGVGLAKGGPVRYDGTRDTGGFVHPDTFVSNRSGLREYMLNPKQTQHFAAGGAVTKSENLSMPRASTSGSIGSLTWALQANTAAVSRNTTAVAPSAALTAANRRKSQFDATVTTVENAQSRVSDAASNVATGLDILNQRKSIRDLQKSLASKKKGERLKGLDRQIAQAELAEAQRELARMNASRAALDKARAALAVAQKNRAKYGSVAQEEARVAAAEAAVEAAEARSEAVASSADAVSDSAGIGDATSASAVNRNLSRTIANIGQFTSVMAALRARGASPWLLAQLNEAGPTKQAIRIGQQYLQNAPALNELNKKTALLSSLGQSYGSLTNDPRFLGSGAAPALSTQQRELLIRVEAMTASEQAAEIARQVKFQMGAMQAEVFA